MGLEDITQVFDKVKKENDGIVDKSAFDKELKSFTLDDWRKLAQTRGVGSVEVGLLGQQRGTYVQEKENEFLVHNDKDALNDRKLLSDLKSFGYGVLDTVIGAGGGYFVGRRFFGNPLMGTVVGAGLGFTVGVLWGKSRNADMEHRNTEANPLRVPKDLLIQEKLAMINQNSHSINWLIGMDLGKDKTKAAVG